jgi:nucleolar protein 53
MGRKLQGAALRAKKRGKLDAIDMVEVAAQLAETQEVTTKPDEELFVLDTTAAIVVAPSKKQQAKKEKNKRKHTNSAMERALIEKLADTHSEEKLQELAKISTAKRARFKGLVKPTFDLWAEEKEETNNDDKKKKKQQTEPPVIGSGVGGTKPSQHLTIVTKRALAAPGKSKVNIDVAKSGQSYNPDRVQHKKVLQEAIEVEQKREEAEIERKAPISTGMSEATRALLLGDSDSDDSPSDVEEEDDNDEDRPIEKKKEKLTRAQRNKQKRVREEQREIDTRKRQKKIQNSVAEAKTVGKKLLKDEALSKEKKAEIQKLKEESERVKGKNVYQQLAHENPVHAPTFPVALSHELNKSRGSLRTIKPKGSLVTDRMTSFTDRDMATKKTFRHRKRVEGKRRKVKVRGKGHAASKEGALLG